MLESMTQGVVGRACRQGSSASDKPAVNQMLVGMVWLLVQQLGTQLLEADPGTVQGGQCIKEKKSAWIVCWPA